MAEWFLIPGVLFLFVACLLRTRRGRELTGDDFLVPLVNGPLNLFGMFGILGLFLFACIIPSIIRNAWFFGLSLLLVGAAMKFNLIVP